MSVKQLQFGIDARARMLQGMDVLTNAVKATLGPKGRNVVLEKSFGAPTMTNDGVSVAKEIDLSDKFENMGAQMLKAVSSRTGDDAGDGTTTATVLAHAMVHEARVDQRRDAYRRRQQHTAPQGRGEGGVEPGARAQMQPGAQPRAHPSRAKFRATSSWSLK